MQQNYSNNDLLEWAKCLVAYAENWDGHFKAYGKFFTQEYWYLLVGVTEAHWRGRPQNVKETKDRMHGLDGHDDRVKDNRIDEAIGAGLIRRVPYKSLTEQEKAKFGDMDGRSTLLLPTQELEMVMRQHLSATLAKAEAMLRTIRRS